MKSALCLLLLTGCVTAQPLPETLTEFVPTGEVNYRDMGATFDTARVRNPKTNLTKRADGSWGGSLGGGIDVSVTPQRVTGSTMTMVLAETGGEKGTVITGQLREQIFRFEIGPKVALIRTGRVSITLPRTTPNSYGARGELELKGEAALADPPWPQFGFALVAAFVTP